MASTRRRREDSPRSSPRKGPYTGPNNRPRPDLRGAPAAQTARQSPSSNKRPRREDRAAKTSTTRSDRRHASHRHQPRQALTSQRSSLRRALRESRELSGGSSPAVPSDSPDSVSAGIQAPCQGLNSPTQPAPRDSHDGSATTHSSESCLFPDLKTLPQRNSLRRAIRESLKAMPPDYMQSSPLTHCSELDSAESNVPSPTPIAKTNVETPKQNKDARYAHQTTWSSSSTQDSVLFASTTPQRSSLRRALRESLDVRIQNNEHIDTAPEVVDTGQSSVPKDTVEEPLRSSMRQESYDSLSFSHEPYPNMPWIHTRDVESTKSKRFTESPPGASNTSPASLTTPSPTPDTYVAPELRVALRPRGEMISEQGLLTQITAAIPSPAYSESLRYHVSDPRPHDRPIPPAAVTTPKSSMVPSMDRSIVGNGKLQMDSNEYQSSSARKGWHQIREITNEVPSGLYLVEWEGRDPRTGVKVSEIYRQLFGPSMLLQNAKGSYS